MTSVKQFLSLEEVADILGVTYQLIYKLARSGELPAVRIGKLYRVARKDLDDYLDKSKHIGSMGTACGACGKMYRSRLSLPGECEQCKTSICTDCWNRQTIRRCRKHGQEKKK